MVSKLCHHSCHDTIIGYGEPDPVIKDLDPEPVGFILFDSIDQGPAWLLHRLSGILVQN